MPKRPRQHQLEDESRLAFRRAIPRAWVFRDSVPDYGIDGTVEIFDEKGGGTGRLFSVQIKATDEPNENLALTVPFRVETFDYYRSIDLPVLVVRYHAPTQKLYVKWFHTFDRYYGRKGKKTLSFRLTDHDEWTAETASRLSADLEVLKQIRAPQLPLPVRFRLAFVAADVHGISRPRLVLQLRDRTTRVRGVLELSEEDQPNYIGRVELSNERIAVFVGGTGFTLHTGKTYSQPTACAKLPGDILVAIALALNQAGHADIAARLISEFAAEANIISVPQVIFAITACMARAHRITEALKLSEALEADESSRAAADMLIAAPLLRRSALSAGEKEYFGEYLKRRIQFAEGSGDGLRTATSHYNLGNHLRGSADKLAIRHYHQAAIYDPRYWERSYFCAELAGLLFEAGRYRLSAVLYKQALNLGGPPSIEPLFADAIMFSGSYAEAESLFEKHHATHEKGDSSEWALKRWLLENVRGLFGIARQKRETRQAIHLCENEGSGADEFKARLEQALTLDALCPLAWFNLGVLHSKASDRDAALLCFTAAALTRKNDVESWANAFGLALSTEQGRHIGPHLLQAAYRLNGDHFCAAVVRFAESQQEGFDRAAFLDLFNRVISAVPKESSPAKMRALFQNEYREIDVPSL
jgi:tetratricopeptide (TPR) repeat protein